MPVLSKKGSSKVCGWIFSGRASMLPLGALSLGLWVIVVDPAFIAGHQSIKNYRIWIHQLDHLPVVMTMSFFLIFSEHPLDKLHANLLHLQFLANNCMYSSHTDNKLCTYCLYLVKFVIFKNLFTFSCWCHYAFYSNCFLMLYNYTGMVVPCAFPWCWRLFTLDQIQLDAYCTVVEWDFSVPVLTFPSVSVIYSIVFLQFDLFRHYFTKPLQTKIIYNSAERCHLFINGTLKMGGE